MVYQVAQQKEFSVPGEAHQWIWVIMGRMELGDVKARQCAYVFDPLPSDQWNGEINLVFLNAIVRANPKELGQRRPATVPQLRKAVEIEEAQKLK